MHTITEQLESPDFKATKSDKRLITYIKQHAKEVPYLPISQIAKESGIGEATITRFTKKLGFSGLQDFKVSLAQENTLSIGRHIVNSSIQNDESAKETAKKLLTANVITLENTVDIIKSDDVQQAARLMIEAKKIIFIGIGYSGIIAQDTNYKFMRIGLNCTSFDSSHTMYMIAALMEQNDLVVAISHSGETDEIIQTTEIAKANGAKVIAITEHKKSRLKAVSDLHLSYISGETTLETGSISTKMAQFFLLDLVYTQVVKELANGAIEKKIKTTDAVNRLKKKRHL